MRLDIKKTYKLYIGGQFPRTESEHYTPIRSAKGGTLLANVCKGSRKDLRNAVEAARKAFEGWSKQTALNRGQVMYRVAEMMEARADELARELVLLGATAAAAKSEVAVAIDVLVHYAGWSDKFAHILGTINPVAGPFYNFSTPEPIGVVGLLAPEKPALLGLIERLAPALVSGNTVVVLASESRPLPAVTLGEILATGDVPGGVGNIITGSKAELAPWLADHQDVDVLDLTGAADGQREALEEKAAGSVKRVVGRADAGEAPPTSLYAVEQFVEIKTVWHPMGV